MVKYSLLIQENVEKTVCARGNDIKVSFKNTHQTAAAIRGKSLEYAKSYLNSVLLKKRCIPFTKFNGGLGRTAQAKEFKLTQGRWPEKSVKTILSLLKNIEANAKNKLLNPEDLIIKHIAVQRAMKGRRRTHRAHGRISPYMSNPCHVEIICVLKKKNVPKPDDADHDEVKLSKKANKKRQLPLAL